MAKVERFEDLTSWQKARELNRRVYQVSKSPMFGKDFGLRDQIRRASISIMSNIAEGFERGGDKEFVQFLAPAKGSCGEVRSQLYAALDELHSLCLEVSRMISALISYLRCSELRGSKFKEDGTTR